MLFSLALSANTSGILRGDIWHDPGHPIWAIGLERIMPVPSDLVDLLDAFKGETGQNWRDITGFIHKSGIECIIPGQSYGAYLLRPV